MDHPSRDGERAEAEMSIEERTLIEFGYEDRLNQVIGGSPEIGSILARNFLKAYGSSPHAQSTEDTLQGYLEMPSSHPDHEGVREYIQGFLEAQFGKPSPKR